MAGLAGGNDEKSALRSGQIGDHPERGADGVRVGTRAAEKAEIDRYTVAAGRKRTDGQEASERPYGIQRMAQHQFVQIPPPPAAYVAAQSVCEIREGGREAPPPPAGAPE